ncbi:hypothetical protein [Mesorhizobium sp. B4-1-4]|uniref:hypothetical protein n=1 Tax=Mesorhizobium sp. B4-1-4 TaxID=2589888 RepID=UPI00112DE6BB|nr:hypothetical protein [Mesorhizobium sp. B4-1-4]UCI32222.1 hypothetical protein FJW03_01815 [Mesorhizobium sp. B4-1-4]
MGDFAFAIPFGALYSTNITPDPETGICAWSEAAFRRAMHEGVARDGSHLFPLFTYDHFTSRRRRAGALRILHDPAPALAPALSSGMSCPFNIRFVFRGISQTAGGGILAATPTLPLLERNTSDPLHI